VSSDYGPNNGACRDVPDGGTLGRKGGREGKKMQRIPWGFKKVKRRCEGKTVTKAEDDIDTSFNLIFFRRRTLDSHRLAPVHSCHPFLTRSPFVGRFIDERTLEPRIETVTTRSAG